MQPQDQQMTPPDGQAPEGGGPVVTLSPDQVEASEPVTANTAPDQQSEQPAPAAQDLREPIHWQATEYTHLEKDRLWFVLLIVATIALTAIAVFLIKSPTFAVLVPVMAVALIAYNHRPPQVLDYTLSHQGLHINDKLYSYAEFKSFGLLRLSGQYSVMLIPIKRFQPALAVNFPEEVGEVIVDMLAARLPMRDMQPDIVDRIIQKLHL